MYNNELMHHGRKGMKWGKHIYTDENGNLTERGQKRYERDVRENKAKKKDNRIVIDGPDPDRWVKEDMTRAKKTVDATKNLNRELQNVERNTRVNTRKNVDLSTMTDQELQAYINRATLEKRYMDLKSYEEAQNVSRGREVVDNILEYSNVALGITSSALAIALAIHELM